MKTRLTNLKRISNRQYPSAALAAGDVAFFALGQIPHDRTLSAAAFLFEPVLVDDLVKTVGELVVEIELAVIRFVFLQSQLGTGAFCPGVSGVCPPGNPCSSAAIAGQPDDP